MSQERNEPEKPERKAWPASVKREVAERSKGICEFPGCESVGADMDHIIPVEIGGKSILENARFLCKHHHAAKTRLDMKLIRKGRRIRGEEGPRRRKEKGSVRPIGSRGFDKGRTRKFNGQVVYRGKKT